jgi:hypothetical protein
LDAALTGSRAHRISAPVNGREKLYVLSVPWSGSAARWAASLGLAGTRCRSVDGAAPQWAGQARKEIERLSRGKAQPFHTSGGTAANTLNTYEKLPTHKMLLDHLGAAIKAIGGPCGNPAEETMPDVQSKPNEPQTQLGDMSAGEFRAYLHQVADWMADYREQIEDPSVSPVVEPGQSLASLPSTPPEHPEPMTAILEDLDRFIMPGMVHWGHPAWLGYVGCATTAPGMLGEMIAAALNVSAMTWRTSPAATELEMLVLDWLRQMVGLPVSFEGVIYDTASVATLHALAAAREATGLVVRRYGLAGRHKLRRLRIYTLSSPRRRFAC